ncbi:MAG: Ca-activated chloride channel family protein [Ulvibacter sp.]|jgi:tetratricopeptide (TPR) repeat protein
MKNTHNISIVEIGFLLKISALFLVFGISSTVLNAQDNNEKLKELKEAQEYLSDASLALQEDEFPIAEANFRKAIALNPANETGKYNLGTAYYGKNKNTEALNRFKQAASLATAKPEKHRAFHNLGNTFMNEKNYTEAVEAFKNALRNNPTDDESRYNLALAKDMLEKNPPQDDKGDDENKDKDDKKEEDDSENKEGDDGDPKEDKDKGDEKEDKKDGEDEKDKGKPDEPKDGEDKKPQEQKPQPGQLSPQQVKSLLDAMNNEEEKVQKKMNAQKQKGAKVKSNKDW